MLEDLYYNPEDFGLTLVGEADLSEPCYSFDIVAVWKDDEGYYLGTDSGCSCPSPFENFHSKDDLTGPLTAAQAIEELGSLKATSYEPDYDPEGFEKLIEKIT